MNFSFSRTLSLPIDDDVDVNELKLTKPNQLNHDDVQSIASNWTFANAKVFIIVVAVCVGFALILMIVWLFCVTIIKRHRRRQQQLNKGCHEYGSIENNRTTTTTMRNWPPLQLVKVNGREACIPFSVPFPVTSSTGASASRVVPTGDFPSSKLTRQTRSLSSIGSSGGRDAAGWADSTESLSTDSHSSSSFGAIDPSLYKTVDDYDDDEDTDFPEGYIGRIRFAVEYNRESEKLLVTLIAARNLPTRTIGSTNACDPFVRICLLPDTRSHLQSRFKKKTCNPKFDESFIFQVSSKTLSERVLKLTVYDVDRLRRHNVIGHVIYAMKGHNFETNEKCLVLRELESDVPENAVGQLGEVRVSLSYNDHNGRLTVGIFEGKNFKKYSESKSHDYYIKVCLMRHSGVVKSKRTDLIKNDHNPKFNESFVFKLLPEILDKTSVSVTAWNNMSGQRDKALGRIVFGSFMFARGKELEHWNEMIANPREQISQWHVLA